MMVNEGLGKRSVVVEGLGWGIVFEVANLVLGRM